MKNSTATSSRLFKVLMVLSLVFTCAPSVALANTSQSAEAEKSSAMDASFGEDAREKSQGENDEIRAESNQSFDDTESLNQESENVTEVVYFQNEEGEYAYIPSSALTEDDIFDEANIAAVSTFATTEVTSVTELGGVDRYETVAKEALYAFSSSDTVIVASGIGYADSIAAAGLAGALDCPILLTGQSSVPEVTQSALKTLGAKNIVLLGSTDVANSDVEKSLKSITGGSVTRVWGEDRYATQLAIYEYGKKRGLWNGEMAIVSAATGFADALSISSISYSLKIPVFFCDGNGSLPSEQQRVLQNEYKAKTFLITGSTVVVSSKTENYIKTLSSSRGGKTVRLGGTDRYATSQAIAEYAVKNLGFAWDGAAFASGRGPYDSLGGGVVQGKEKSILLLADEVDSSSVNVITRNGGKVSSIKFFGSTVVVPSDVRSDICATLNISYQPGTTFVQYDISRSKMAQLQVNRNEGNGYNYSAFYQALNPEQHEYGTSAFYQFAVLNNGHSGLSASSLNSYVASKCSYQESQTGRISQLRNAGSYFVAAAQKYGINEVYLLSHAIWESGWGCSELATGWTPTQDGTVVVNGVSYPYHEGTTYYNFYGIGAVDSNALSGGRAMAVKEGWTSPEKAVLGAAKWISTNYINRNDGRGKQNTLYLMKWDLFGAINENSAWHEYCTGTDSWVLGISRLMSNCYASSGKSFGSTGLKFSVPVYSAN